MIRVGFSGVPCTGKTTLARAFSVAVRDIPNINTIELISEYARTYISRNKSIDHIWEQYRIVNKQLQMEMDVSNDTDLMVTDSPIQLAFLYANNTRENSPKDNMVFEDIFQIQLKESTENPYDIIFHLPPASVDLVDDGVRPPQHLDFVWRRQSDEFIKTSFNMFKARNFYEISPGTLDERVNVCINIFLSHHDK